MSIFFYKSPFIRGPCKNFRGGPELGWYGTD